MMQHIITAVQDYLQQQVPALQYIDEDWGQLNYYSSHPPVKFPAALIDIASLSYSNLAHPYQQGSFTLLVTIAHIKNTNSSAKAPVLQKKHAHQIWDTIQQVINTLHGWIPHTSCTKLIRSAITKKENDDGVKIYSLAFTASITEGNPKRKTINNVSILPNIDTLNTATSP